MDIELFDKRYVYLEWSDELEGKDCILAKSYKDLKDFVNSGDEGRFCKVNKGREKPFTNGWSECDFCYFDNNLKVKKAWIEGKTIQKRDLLNEWEDYINTERISLFFYNIKWDAHEWRVKPTEFWYVVFAGHYFMRVSIINNEFNTVFFKGTYEECGKWIDEHDSLSSVVSAFLRGDTIQWKPKNRINEWQDWKSSEFPTVNTMDENYWRIKPKYNLDSNYQPTEPIYYLSVNKNGYDYLEFTISQNITNDTIYEGTRKECERMMKIIADEFGEEVFSHWDTPRLRYIIDKYSHEKYKRRMTNRELSEYLAKGNGEVKNLECFVNSIFHCYKNNAENENVDDNILIRDFGSDEWRPPLIEV